MHDAAALVVFLPDRDKAVTLVEAHLAGLRRDDEPVDASGAFIVMAKASIPAPDRPDT